GFRDGVREGGRAGPAGAVGRGGDDGAAEQLKDLARQRMRRRPHRDRIQSGAGQVANGGCVGQRRDERERARPEGFDKRNCASIKSRETLGRGAILHMGDQRVEPGPALGGVEPCDRLGVGGVGGQAIDGLGGQDDQFARRERAGGGGGGGQWARWAVRATFTVTLLSTTSLVLHLPCPMPNAVRLRVTAPFIRAVSPLIASVKGSATGLCTPRMARSPVARYLPPPRSLIALVVKTALGNFCAANQSAVG